MYPVKPRGHVLTYGLSDILFKWRHCKYSCTHTINCRASDKAAVDTTLNVFSYDAVWDETNKNESL